MSVNSKYDKELIHNIFRRIEALPASSSIDAVIDHITVAEYRMLMDYLADSPAFSILQRTLAKGSSNVH